LFPTIVDGDGVAVPIYVNAKVGTPEGALHEHQPGWSFGVYNLDVDADVPVLYAMVGKTLPYVGSVSVGGYHGLDDVGVLAGWASPAIDVPKIDKLVLTADVQTGHNALGAAGAGVYVYFTPAVALLTGPVFFLEPDLQPGGNRWMWSAQIDIDVDLGANP